MKLDGCMAEIRSRSDREVRFQQVRVDMKTCPPVGTDSRIRALIWAGAWHLPTASQIQVLRCRH